MSDIFVTGNAKLTSISDSKTVSKVHCPGHLLTFILDDMDGGTAIGVQNEGIANGSSVQQPQTIECPEISPITANNNTDEQSEVIDVQDEVSSDCNDKQPEVIDVDSNNKNNGEQEEPEVQIIPPPKRAPVLRPLKGDPRRPAPSSCVYSPHCFCYVCGKFAALKSQRKVDRVLRAAYEAYFGRKITNIDKPWTPNNFCGTCSGRLSRWYKFGTGQLDISVPAVWRQPVVHETDCFFCLMPNIGFGFTAMKFKAYPWHAASVDQPVPHDERHPVPLSPMVNSKKEQTTPVKDVELEKEVELTSNAKNDESFINLEPVLFNADNYNDLLDKMTPPLTKAQEKALSSTLLEMNLLHLTRRSGRQKGLKRKNYATIETPAYADDIDLQVFKADEQEEKSYQKKAKGEDSDDDDNHDPEYRPSKEEERLGDGKDSLCVIMDLICPVESCSIRVHSRPALDEHLEATHNALRYRCLAISCTASFVRRKQLAAHIQAAHKDPSCWVCGRCNVVKSDYAHLRNHINFHHQLGHMRCGFEECTFASMECSQGMVKRHLRSHVEPKFQCDFVGCGKTYKTKSALSRHFMSHNNDRRYQCSFCEKTFYGSTDLSRHELIHKGQKNYKCDQCNRRFTLKGSLDKHQKSQNHYQKEAIAPAEVASVSVLGGMPQQDHQHHQNNYSFQNNYY